MTREKSLGCFESEIPVHSYAQSSISLDLTLVGLTLVDLSNPASHSTLLAVYVTRLIPNPAASK